MPPFTESDPASEIADKTQGLSPDSNDLPFANWKMSFEKFQREGFEIEL